MFTPRKVSAPAEPPEIPSTVAAEIAVEFASLRAPRNCPRGMYLTPSPDTLLRWHAVFFLHRGPYAGSILRFTLKFPTSFPAQPPVVYFDSDVFHPLIDPKTHIWNPRGRTAQWQPGVDHVPQLLYAVKASFKSTGLDAIAEDEAANRQVWSLYRHSPQTFLSLTAQRAMHSTTRQSLYPPPPSTSQSTGTSATSSPQRRDPAAAQGPIRFREMAEGERDVLWSGLRASLGG